MKRDAEVHRTILGSFIVLKFSSYELLCVLGML
jgi:hypothetical protein